MQQIPGKTIADEIRREVKSEVASMNILPTLGVILVGDDPASRLYVSLKEKAARDAGMLTDIRRLDASTKDGELIGIIQTWNLNPAIDAILVQLPLPLGHDADRVIATIEPTKDVDGFHTENVRKLAQGEATIIPPVHEAIMRLIAHTGVDPRGKSATILANSGTFALPLSYLLQKAGFVTAIMDPDDMDKDLLKDSDVIVSAVGRCNFVGRDLVKPGAVLIDVGTSKGPDGKSCGDINAESVDALEGWRSPVPGGIGPMTVALLLKNVVRLATRD